MTTYHQEKVQTAIAKALECLARDPKRAERLLGDVKKWSAEAEREAYMLGKADAERQRVAGKPVAYRVSDPAEPDIGSWLSEDKGATWQKSEPLYAAPLASAEASLLSGEVIDAAVASAKGAGDVGECSFSDLIDAYTDAVRNGNFSERVAARAELMNSYRQQRGGGTDAAVAAIRFALEADDGMAWLRCWNEGDFDACRNEWPETPEECFIGADPLHPSTRAILAAQPAASAEPSKEECWDLWQIASRSRGFLDERIHRFARELLDRYGSPALAAHKPDGGDAMDAERLNFVARRCTIWDGYKHVKATRENIDAAISAQYRQEGK